LFAATRIWLSVTSPDPGTLEQSLDDGKTWSEVCTLPCQATVVSAPVARHRVKTKTGPVPIDAIGEDGEHFDVVVNAPSRARMPLLYAAIATTMFSTACVVELGVNDQWSKHTVQVVSELNLVAVVASAGLFVAAFVQPNKGGYSSWRTERPE
jgi:hypothetical protein